MVYGKRGLACQDNQGNVTANMKFSYQWSRCINSKQHGEYEVFIINRADVSTANKDYDKGALHSKAITAIQYDGDDKVITNGVDQISFYDERQRGIVCQGNPDNLTVSKKVLHQGTYQTANI